MKYHEGMTQKEMWTLASQLLAVFDPFIVWDFDKDFNYYLSEDAPSEAIEASEEYRLFIRKLKPIR